MLKERVQLTKFYILSHVIAQSVFNRDNHALW